MLRDRESGAQKGCSSETKTTGSGPKSQVKIWTDTAQPSPSADTHIKIPTETSVNPTNNAPDMTETQEEVDEYIYTQDETVVNIANERLDSDLTLICTNMKTHQ